MKTNVTSYSAGSKAFHWLISIIVITMLSLSFFLDGIPKQYQPVAYMIHKSAGLTVLFLMIARFFWLQYCGKPALPPSVPRWQKIAAHFLHYSLYVGIICMALFGWIMSVAAGKIPSYFGMFSLSLPIAPNKALSKLMNQSHKTMAWVLIVLIVLHIVAAIKHHFIDKDVVLKRMLPGHNDR
ncbi:MAG: cytochrome b [Legionellales bacterium]|nr:cytochrome b [Legionellales bacterium]